MTCNSHWWSLGIVTEMVWFCLYASWITVDDIKSRSQKKQKKVILKLQFALISRNKLFIYQALYFTLSLYTIFLLPLSLSVLREKLLCKYFSLVSCFVENKFCWQSAEIRLPYHLGFIYAKWSDADSGLVKLVVMTNLFFNNQQHEIKTRQLICVKQIKSSFFSNNGNQFFY